MLRGKFQDSKTYIIIVIVSKEDLYLLRQLSSIYIQMATIKEKLPVSGIRQIAVTYSNLPSRNGKLPSRVAAALAWRGALGSLLSLTLSQNQSNIQYHTSYKLQLRNITLCNQHYSFNFYKIGPLFNINTKPNIERLIVLSYPQLALLKLISIRSRFLSPLQVIPLLSEPARY